MSQISESDAIKMKNVIISSTQLSQTLKNMKIKLNEMREISKDDFLSDPQIKSNSSFTILNKLKPLYTKIAEIQENMKKSVIILDLVFPDKIFEENKTNKEIRYNQKIINEINLKLSNFEEFIDSQKNSVNIFQKIVDANSEINISINFLRDQNSRNENKSVSYEEELKQLKLKKTFDRLIAFLEQIEFEMEKCEIKIIKSPIYNSKKDAISLNSKTIIVDFDKSIMEQLAIDYLCTSEIEFPEITPNF